MATTAVVTAWLGNAYVAAPGTGGGVSSTTVIYESAPVEEAAVEELPTTTLANVAEPAASAEEWLLLGVYSLTTSTAIPPTQMLELNVDHQGVVRGLYYDSITNTTQNVVGSIDSTTQVVRWTLESNNQLTFQVPLNDLMQPTAKVQVALPTGMQQWHLTRVELADNPQ